MSKTIVVVVARYNENIEWTKQFPNVTIYNKGEKLNENNEIMLDNVGREGHTYFYHIYNNYENLSDYIVFLQGDPFEHSPNILSNLHNYINNKNLNIDFAFLSEYMFNCNLNGCSLHKDIPLIEIYEKLFNVKKTDMGFRFGAGAQFIVSKERILQRPKEFYLKIIKMLENDINPIEGFVIERFHTLIFN